MLTTEDSRVLDFNLGFRFNQAWARGLFGDDGRYWDHTQQMSIEKRDDGWYVVPNDAAGNETLVDGRRITEPTKLAAGQVIAVGREAKGIEKTRLKVSF
jgi:hypothetical protein